MMKKLLYVGHAYHNKTKSTDFLQEMFKQKYEVETFSFDPYHDDMNTRFLALKGKVYDVVVIFQVPVEIEKFRLLVKSKQYVFFPMYDCSLCAGDNFWYSYRKVKIINFSKTLHDKLSQMGLDSHYIQYFPPADKTFVAGDEKSIFFWARVCLINVKLVAKLFSKIGFDKLHIHKAIDPGHTFKEPDDDIASKIEYSTWYEKKEDMLKDIRKAQIYIAPRHVEGIGMSFLEAMAMGRCVVSPNNPTMNEYIVHGQNGILYDLDNPKPLNKFDALQIGKNAHRYIQEGYKKWDSQKLRILDWLEEPLKTNKKMLKRLKGKAAGVVSYKLFCLITLLSITKSVKKIKVKLFGFLPLLTIKKD